MPTHPRPLPPDPVRPAPVYTLVEQLAGRPLALFEYRAGSARSRYPGLGSAPGAMSQQIATVDPSRELATSAFGSIDDAVRAAGGVLRAFRSDRNSAVESIALLHGPGSTWVLTPLVDGGIQPGGFLPLIDGPIIDQDIIRGPVMVRRLNDALAGVVGLTSWVDLRTTDGIHRTIDQERAA